jgi:hypothetical protein
MLRTAAVYGNVQRIWAPILPVLARKTVRPLSRQKASQKRASREVTVGSGAVIEMANHAERVRWTKPQSAGNPVPDRRR